MPHLDSWMQNLRQRGMIVLPCGDDTHLLVDSLRPWRAVRAAAGDRDAAARLEQVASPRRSRTRCELVYCGAWPAPEAAMEAIRNTAERFGPQATALRIFYDRGADLVAGLNAFAGPHSRCTAQLLGPLTDLSEDDAAVLVQRGARVIPTVGWPHGAEPDVERLRRYSEWGLRLPVTFYVRRDNLDELPGLANRLQHANYNAGVAFEPVCAHPGFTSRDVDWLPPPEDYAEFLVEAYRQYPHNDDVFEPIASLVQNLCLGGWDLAGDRPLPVRYRIDGSGRIRPFRQFPWEAPLRQVDAGEAGLVSLAPDCRDCPWRCACGGCEATVDELFQVVCEYRMLFLEYLVRRMHESLTVPTEAAHVV